MIAGRAATNPTAFDLPDSNVTDGESREFNILMGVSTEDGRGNITAYAGVRDNKKVLQRDRDYSACSLDSNPTESFECGGSATSFPGYFYFPSSIPNPDFDPVNDPPRRAVIRAFTIDPTGLVRWRADASPEAYEARTHRLVVEAVAAGGASPTTNTSFFAPARHRIASESRSAAATFSGVSPPPSAP